MKTRDVLMLAGAGLAAWYFLGRKTTATEEGGGGTFISGLTDLSWLSGLIPQNMIPSISIGGTSDITSPLAKIQDLLASILPGAKEILPAAVTTPASASGQPDDTTPAPSNAPDSEQLPRITGETPWMEILKRWIGATTPETANLGTKIGLITGGAAVIGGGMFAYRTLLPGTRAVATGISEGIGSLIKGVGKGGRAGTLAMLPPGLMTPEGQRNVITSFKQAGIGWGLLSLISGEAYQPGGVQVRGEGIAVAPPTMRTGEAPAVQYTVRQGQVQAVRFPTSLAEYTRGYAVANTLSQSKPLGGGQVQGGQFPISLAEYQGSPGGCASAPAAAAPAANAAAAAAAAAAATASGWGAAWAGTGPTGRMG